MARRRFNINRHLAALLQLVVDFCKSCCNVKADGGHISIDMVDAFLADVQALHADAKSAALRNPRGASLDIDGGLYLLVESLKGRATARDWILTYVACKQRHLTGKHKDSEPNLDVRDQRLIFMILSMRAIQELDNDDDLFLDMFTVHLNDVTDSTLNEGQKDAFFRNHTAFEGRYWTTTVLFNILGVTAEDVERHTVCCPACFDPVANRRNRNDDVKLGIRLVCGHLMCEACLNDPMFDAEQCPQCRAGLAEHPEQRAIYEDFAR